MLWRSKVKRSKIGLFSGPFLLTGRVLISLFTNSPKIYLSVHRLCHLLLQNIFLCRRKKRGFRGQRNMGMVLHRFLIRSCSKVRNITEEHFSLGLWAKARPLANKFLTFSKGLLRMMSTYYHIYKTTGCNIGIACSIWHWKDSQLLTLFQD